MTLISMMWPRLICCLPDYLLDFFVWPRELASDGCRCVPTDRTHNWKCCCEVSASLIFFIGAAFRLVSYPSLPLLFLSLSLICKEGDVTTRHLACSLIDNTWQPTHAWAIITFVTIALQMSSDMQHRSVLLFPWNKTWAPAKGSLASATRLSFQSKMWGNKVEHITVKKAANVFSHYQVWVRVNEAEHTGKCGEHGLLVCKPGNHRVVRCVKWSSLCSRAQRGPQM